MGPTGLVKFRGVVYFAQQMGTLQAVCWSKQSVFSNLFWALAGKEEKLQEKVKNTQKGVYQPLSAPLKCWQTPKSW